MLAPHASKKKLQRKVTKDYYWKGAEENIGMFSDLRYDCNSFVYLSPFERQVRPIFNKRLVNESIKACVK